MRKLVAPLAALATLSAAALAWEGASIRFLSAFLVAFLALGYWLSQREPDELAELESELSRARSDLNEKSHALTRERQELGILMASISDGILAVERDGRPLFFNSRFANLFLERDSNPATLGEIFRNPKVLDAYQEVLATGEVTQAELALFIKGDLIAHYFSISIAPLRRAPDNQNGPVYGAIGVFHDVTELKRADRIRVDFVANVSHELRTPLTSIKTSADTLSMDVAEDRFDPEIAKKLLGMIQRNAERLIFLLNDLLQLSTLESREPGQLFQKMGVSTEEATDRALSQIESRRAAKGQVIETEFRAKEVLGDPGRVEQVLVNLLENAVKYVPEKGKIRVVWESEPSAVVLRVSDNGPGIPPEHLPRLFERFYRVDAGRSRDSGGTGLGLAIVKHVLIQHGGTVSVASELDRGTEFTCRFPLT